MNKFCLNQKIIILFAIIFGTFGLNQVVHSSIDKDQLLLDQKGDQIVSILVQIELPTPFQTESSLTRSSISLQREAIKEAQSDLLKSLSSTADIQLNAQFEMIPYLSLMVDRADLDVIKKHSVITHVVEDRPIFLQLDSSVPLVGATHAWEIGLTGEGQTVAMFDSGIDASHPFFEGRVVAEACFSNGDGQNSSLCPNGESQQVGSGSSSPSVPGCQANGISLCYHGTHVAGTMAGDGESFRGVAPDASIISIQSFTRADSGTCWIATGQPACVITSYADLLRGLEHVYIDLSPIHNIAAINMSLGGEQFTDQATCDAHVPALTTMFKQYKEAGIAVIAATGNNSWVNAMSFPACISHAVAVGAIDDDRNVAEFSNMHDMVDIVSPGVSITSAIPGNQFATGDGTSFAAPHVAGAWAILAQDFPEESVDGIYSKLTSAADRINDQRPSGVTETPVLDLGRLYGPQLSYYPGSIYQTAKKGEGITFTVNLTNTGVSTLTWQGVGPSEPDQTRSILDSPPLRLSHSISNTIQAGNSRKCETGDQSWLRVFSLDDFAIQHDIILDEVEFGVESSTSFFFGQTLYVRAYILEGESLQFNQLVQIGEQEILLSDKSFDLVKVPLDAEVPASSTIVIEVALPEFQLFGLDFQIGSNKLGQAAPTYHYAPGCGQAEPADVATLGYEDMNLVLNVFGHYADESSGCTEWINSGRLAMSTQSGRLLTDEFQSVALAINTSGLELGNYEELLCFETNDNRFGLLSIPMNIEILCDNLIDCETLTPPAAGFSLSSQEGIAPLTVTFENSSLGEIDSFEWNFGDGQTSTEPSPTHTYLNAGYYQPSLKVINKSGESIIMSDINVFAPAIAGFSSHSVSIETSPLTVQFINQSMGDFETCKWLFGDGQEATMCEGVIHQYDTGGTYTASLLISGKGGSSSAMASIKVTEKYGVYFPFISN